ATEFLGKKFTRVLKDVSGPGAFAYVDTGNSLPTWANAVIMIEKVRQLDDDTVEIFESVAPWNHVRLVGEDVVATELLLPRCHRLRPYDRGALLAAGHTSVGVKVHPKVGIIPTGDELIQPGEETKPGAVIDFNSTVLASFVREWGGAPIKYPRARDACVCCAGGGGAPDQIPARARREECVLEGGAPRGRRVRYRHDHSRLVG